MSDYYYLKDKNEESGYSIISGDDYIFALEFILKKNGIKASNKMILEEAYGVKANGKREESAL